MHLAECVYTGTRLRNDSIFAFFKKEEAFRNKKEATAPLKLFIYIPQFGVPAYLYRQKCHDEQQRLTLHILPTLTL